MHAPLEHSYVYQKAYVEFFVSPDKLGPLLEKLDQSPSITYMAVNKEGDVKSNMKQDTVNAVTWGVFPGARGCVVGCVTVRVVSASVCLEHVLQL